MSLAFLPDIKTEAPGASGLPLFYRHKPDTAARDMPGATTRDYLTVWLSQWVRDYGIDGFRVDTAKHVEKPTLALLKQRARRHWRRGKRSIRSRRWMTRRFG